jgi:predicted Zn-dependent peptidase
MKSAALLSAALSVTLGNAAHASPGTRSGAPVLSRENPAQTEVLSVRKPVEFLEYNLPNGLHVILHQNRSAPVIATYVLYRVGSKNERPDRTGFAHFFEHLMFEGSEFIPRGTIDKYISSAGGNLNASTSFDQTDYYFNLPSHQLPLALWIESERMLHPRIDEAGVETQRAVVKEERRRSYDNQPYGSMFEELCGLVFEGTPYQWVPIGSFQYIDKATIDEFRDFHKTFYRPENATLVVAGDFEVEDTKKLIADYFATIPNGQSVPRPEFQWTLDVQGKSKDVARKNTPLPALIHAWRSPSETEADAYPLEMLANVMAEGRSSRLHQSLVEKKGLAMSVTSYPSFLEKAGMLALSVTGQSSATLEELDAALLEEVKRAYPNGIPVREDRRHDGRAGPLASALLDVLRGYLPD